MLSDEFENVIVLSDEFYREVSEHPIPTDLDAVRVPSASPAVLDLFMWLSYRCFSVKNEESIPLSGGLGLSLNSAMLSMLVLVSSERSSKNGCRWFWRCGRNARLRFRLMGRSCLSVQPRH